MILRAVAILTVLRPARAFYPVHSYRKTACGYFVDWSRLKVTSPERPEVDDEAMLAALEKLEVLDEKFGEGIGASKERAKAMHIIRSWEEEQRCMDESGGGNLGRGRTGSPGRTLVQGVSERDHCHSCHAKGKIAT